MATKKVKIIIRNLEDSFKEAKKVAREIDRGIFKKHTPVLSFGNFAIYKKILTEKRLGLLRTIKSKKPSCIKQLAIITHRDFKNVYDDVKMLESVGLIKLKKDGSRLVPLLLYDEIELDIKIPLKVVSR